MTVESIDSDRKRVTVDVPQNGAWWNPSHQIADQPFVDVVIEPYEGGAWYEVDASGARCQWGAVLAWEPPSRVLLNWQLDTRWEYAPDLVTELEVTFTPLSATSTLVTLEHRQLENLGEGAEAARLRFDDPGGWQGLLDRFVTLVGASEPRVR
jgi:uncharacterized protein YndB with AHSA1/START domain